MTEKEKRLATLLNNLICLYMEETIGTYDSTEEWYDDFYNLEREHLRL